jgi:hypothetical protein
VSVIINLLSILIRIAGSCNDIYPAFKGSLLQFQCVTTGGLCSHFYVLQCGGADRR